MHLIHVILLAVIQGMAELLPVSSSAHVIVVGRFLGWDPTTPEGAFLLVMLHTGTMGAVLVYFWPRWRAYVSPTLETRGDSTKLRSFFVAIVAATGMTGVLGLALKFIIERAFLPGGSKAEIEQLFGNLPLIATALFGAGCVILLAGQRRQRAITASETTERESVGLKDAFIVGAVQGICLPFRGFSRSGATISAGMLLGISKRLAEDFSFALAIALTPAVLVREGHRLWKASANAPQLSLHIGWGLIGMLFSFAAGLFALKWLSSWIEHGHWKWFGYYCLAASLGVWIVYLGT